MKNAVDLSSAVSLDYEILYESGKYTDISINVGKEPHSKILFAHSIILCSRCKYLENEIRAGSDTLLIFEDIMPDVFEILLR